MSSPQITWDDPTKKVKWDEPAQQSPSLLNRVANEPNSIPLDSYAHATERGLANIGQGVAQTAHAIAHPIDTATGMWNTAKKYGSALAGNEQAATDLVNSVKQPFSDPLAAGDAAGRGAGQIIGGMAVGEAASAARPVIAAAPSVIKPVLRGAGSVATIVGEAAKGDFPGMISPRIPHIGGVISKVGKVATRLGQETPPASEGLPEVEAAQPQATQQLKARIATERDLRSQPPFPRVSEGLPEVEEAQPVAEQHLRSAVAPKPEAKPLSTVKPAKVGELLNDATGGKALIANVPLRQQLSNVTPVVPKESSVIKSHSYDPEARELTVETQNGGKYVHGDVSPEQAQSLATADSKGKAWNDIRNNSTLVAKYVGGKRTPVKPVGPKIATPNDLTPILEDSVAQAKNKRK